MYVGIHALRSFINFVHVVDQLSGCHTSLQGGCGVVICVSAKFCTIRWVGVWVCGDVCFRQVLSCRLCLPENYKLWEIVPFQLFTDPGGQTHSRMDG